MDPNLPSGNPTETTLVVKATELATQFANNIEAALASQNIHIKISALMSGALPLISHVGLVIASVSATVLTIHLGKRRMLRKEIRDHSRAVYLTFWKGGVHKKSERSASLTDIFGNANSEYVSLIKKGMKKAAPDNVIVELDGPIYTEVIMSLLQAYYIDNGNTDAEDESRRILRDGDLPPSRSYIGALIHLPSYSRETGEVFKRGFLFRLKNGTLFHKGNLKDRTFTQLEYVRIPKENYDELKGALDKIAKEQGRNIKSIRGATSLDSEPYSDDDKKEILGFLDPICINDSTESREIIDALFSTLFVNKNISAQDARFILIEKKDILTMIHIIRYELSGGYIYDESTQGRQGKKDPNANQYDIS